MYVAYGFGVELKLVAQKEERGSGNEDGLTISSTGLSKAGPSDVPRT